MNLADPFGRMKTRREKEYASLRASLIEAGITTADQAEDVLNTAQNRGKWAIVVALVVTILLSAIFSEGMIVIVTLGALFCFWVYKVTSNGHRYIRRYIDEELNSEQDGHSEE